MIGTARSVIAQRGDNAPEHVDFWSFDVLKVFLAVIVVIRHCAQSFWPTDSIFYIAVVNMLSPVAVPTFFALSGFLLFRKSVTIQRLVLQIKRILKLYLVWTIVYLPLTAYSAWKTPEISIEKHLFTYFQNFLFSGSHYHLWFLPALASSLLLVWFLDKHVSQRTQCILVTSLFLIGAIVQNFAFLLPDAFLPVYNLYCRIFITTRNGLFFGCLFVWIGKYFSRACQNLNPALLKKSRLILLLSLLGLIVEGFILSKVHETFVVDMLFAAVPFVILLLKLVTHLSISRQCSYRTKRFREASTFLFCFHPIAMLAIPILEKIGIFVPRFLSMVLVLLICGVAAFLFDKLAPRIRLLQHLV